MPIFALDLYKFTPAKKNLHEYTRGVRDKYQECCAQSTSNVRRKAQAQEK